MKRLIVTLGWCISLIGANAQQAFIKSAKITFEKKTDLQREMAANKAIPDFVKEKMDKYEVSNWEYTFNEQASSYKIQNSGGSFSGTKSEMFTDFGHKMRTAKKLLMDNYYILSDSIPKLSWKILRDVRNIAGYQCRKAITLINDSVYVVAFYANEILPMGGPEGFTGLPGMIMGLAIPRYHTTWFATQVEVINIDFDKIVPPKNGRNLADTENLGKFVEAYMFLTKPKEQKQTTEKIKKEIFGLLL